MVCAEWLIIFKQEIIKSLTDLRLSSLNGDEGGGGGGRRDMGYGEEEEGVVAVAVTAAVRIYRPTTSRHWWARGTVDRVLVKSL